MCIYIYIYIYILSASSTANLRHPDLLVTFRPGRRSGGVGGRRGPRDSRASMANLGTKILDFRGFDSSIILIFRGGILMSIRNFPYNLSQAILVGIILVGRLGVMGGTGWGVSRALRELTRLEAVLIIMIVVILLLLLMIIIIILLLLLLLLIMIILVMVIMIVIVVIIVLIIYSYIIL